MTLSALAPAVQETAPPTAAEDDLLTYLQAESGTEVVLATGPIRHLVWQGGTLVAVGLTAEGALLEARLLWSDNLRDDGCHARPLSSGLIEEERSAQVVAVGWPLELIESLEPVAVEDGAL